jgi:hypothetical protein
MAARAKAKPSAKPAARAKAKVKAKATPTTAAKAAVKTRAKPKATAKSRGMGVGPPDPAVREALDRALGSHPELRTGQMFGCPGYFLGAKAVACVFGGEGCLTLPALEVAALVQQPGYRLFQAGGRTMTGWVLLDSARVDALATDGTLIDHAIEYARSKIKEAPRRAAGPPPSAPR